MFCRDFVSDEKPRKFNVGQNLWEDLEHKRKVEPGNLIKETCSTSLSHANIKLKQGGNTLSDMWKASCGNVYLGCDTGHKTPLLHWPTPRQERWNPRAGNWCSVKSRCRLETTGPVCPVCHKGASSVGQQPHFLELYQSRKGANIEKCLLQLFSNAPKLEATEIFDNIGTVTFWSSHLAKY